MIAEEGRSELNKVQNKIYRIGSLRLLLFVAGIAGIIYFWSSGWIVLTGIIAVTLLPFILLIKYHNRLFHRKDYLEKKIAINEQELSALNYDTSSFEDGAEFINPAHLYSYDLDVFGPHSLFQYINRTCTQLGKSLLANWLGTHLVNKKEIESRQEAIRELTSELNFRQEFRILGLLYKGKAADEDELKAWESQCLPEKCFLSHATAIGGWNKYLMYSIGNCRHYSAHCFRYSMVMLCVCQLLFH